MSAHPVKASVTNIKARDETGRAIRTMEQMQQDHAIASMRLTGKTYREISEELGIPDSTLQDMVTRAWMDLPLEGTETMVKQELAKLDALDRKYWAIMEKHHPYVTQSGKIPTLDGEIIEDDTPVMQAMAGLLRVADRRAKFLGLNAPTRTELTGVIVTADYNAQGEQAKAAVLSLLSRLSDDE